MIELSFEKTVTLAHSGDCRIIGFDETHIYVEETYTDDDWLAGHVITFDGVIVRSVDEDFGKNQSFSPLTLPQNLNPVNILPEHPLNYSGARLRGIREEDRIAQLVQPLTIQEKMHLLAMSEAMSELKIPPMLLLGVAESRVLSETRLLNMELIVRRLRLAYALPEVHKDDDGLPYDYDTILLHVMHLVPFDHDGDISLTDAIQHLDGVRLKYPTSATVIEDGLFITENGDERDARLNQLHIWRIAPAT